MAGSKRFDREAALDRAMEAFWSRGYEGASIQVLERNTGVARSSLYATFGDKERLFLQVLERYQERVMRPILAPLFQAGSARGAVAESIEAYARHLSDPEHPPGCLLTRSAAEKGSAADVVGRTVRQQSMEVEDAVYGALRRAQLDGELNRDTDPRAAARFVVALFHGLAVTASLQPDPKALRDSVNMALAALPG